ncbi:MATE family efflux transporter [Clostridium thermobutyricum]|uniref:MATE family efflux transporter n=1 Tax=Clostridium thermobutyricum TaxID=29372 RepID=UPI0018AA0B87|nr:MATE family efflux transporter [Clostridium thermobutyricum]
MKNNDLLHDNLGKLVLDYMIPSILGMLGLSCCIFLDTMFIGRGMGERGLAALNLGIPFFNIFAAISLLTGIGGATLLSINIGKKKYETLNEIFTLSIFITIIISLLITVFGLYFINDIIRLLGASGIIFTYVKEYLEVIFWGSILFILSLTLNVFVRNDGSPKISMWAIIGSNITNIILDYILIFPLNMGMRGAAIATTTAQLVGIIILAFHFIMKKNKIKISIKALNFRYSKRILANGFSSFIVELSAGVVIILFNIKLKELGGDISISAYSIIANFSLIVIAIFNGIAQGIQPIISTNYGGGKNNRVINTYKIGLKIIIIVGGVFFLLGIIDPYMIIKIFAKGNNKLDEIASLGIKIYFIAFIPMGINILNVGVLQSIESSKISTMISLLRGLILIIVFLEIFSLVFKLNGVWITTPVVEIVTFIISIYFMRKEKEKLKKMI